MAGLLRKNEKVIPRRSRAQQNGDFVGQAIDFMGPIFGEAVELRAVSSRSEKYL